MGLIVTALVLLAALAGAWLLLRSRSAAPPVRPAGGPAPRPLRTPLPPARPAEAPAPPTLAPLPELPPEALGSFNWRVADGLPADHRDALVTAVRRIPRPPAALHQMLSPQFLDRASSNALSELITAEAQIAAKVLATVNAPYHGLQRPVSGIGQAVTFLGLNTVRSICLQSLLQDAFKPTHPAQKQVHAEIWNASALASELCTRLCAKLGLADAGALVAQVLLSFLGHLATATLLAGQPGPAGARLSCGPLLDRTRAAQDQLGLGPAEIGALLLREWGLPDAIVNEVRAIDQLLVTPAGQLRAEHSQRLAVAHLCARLGEHLATGGPTTAGSLAGLAAGQAQAEDGFHLRAHLAAPALARLPEHLQAPDLVQALQTLQQGMQARR
jgi:HD-like signal output (HDOD) protein